MALERVQQSTTADSALRAVRNAILDGSFPAGSQLRETQIAAELGISRAPLREALHRLEQESLVERIPYRGAYVAEVSSRTAIEIASLRTMLEPYAVERALPALAGPDGLAELVEAVETLGSRTDEGDRAGSIEAHLAVHRALYRASGNQVLLEAWNTWESQLRLFFAFDHQAFPELSNLAESHRALLVTIQSGDIRKIRHEIARHIHPILTEEASQ